MKTEKKTVDDQTEKRTVDDLRADAEAAAKALQEHRKDSDKKGRELYLKAGKARREHEAEAQKVAAARQAQRLAQVAAVGEAARKKQAEDLAERKALRKQLGDVTARLERLEKSLGVEVKPAEAVSVDADPETPKV